MKLITEVTDFVKLNDFLNEVKKDEGQIENSDMKEKKKGWDDLTFFLQRNPEFQSLFAASSAVSTYLGRIIDSTKTYLESVTFDVQSYNKDGTSALMNGDHKFTALDYVLYGDSASATISYSFSEKAAALFGLTTILSGKGWIKWGKKHISAAWKDIVKSDVEMTKQKNYFFYKKAWYNVTASASIGDWLKYAAIQNNGNHSALDNAIAS